MLDLTETAKVPAAPLPGLGGRVAATSSGCRPGRGLDDLDLSARRIPAMVRAMERLA